MRVLVVDDHELVRRGIVAVLKNNPIIRVCGEAVDGRDAVQQAEVLRPDLIVMDISMPHMNGLEATREIRRLQPSTRIVIVSQHENPEMVRQALDAGALAYVVKSAVATDLTAAIEQVRRNKSYVRHPDLDTRDHDAQEVIQRSAAFERSLRDCQNLFRATMANTLEGVYALNAEGKAIYVNPQAEKLLGWSATELVGRQIANLIRLGGQTTEVEDFHAEPAGESQVQHIFLTRRDGSTFPVRARTSTLVESEGSARTVVNFQDDTEFDNLEKSLERSKAFLQSIGESMRYGIWISDANGKNIYASSSFLTLLGFSQQEYAGLHHSKILHPEDVNQSLASFEHSLKTGKSWANRHRFKGADGEWHDVYSSGVPVRDHSGRILHWAGLNLDVEHFQPANA